MARMGSFSIDGMGRLQRQLEKIEQGGVEAFLDSCAKELAARLLAGVIKRTPVGEYSKEIEVVAKRDSKRHKKGDTYTKRVNASGKKGGTLRRGWISQTHAEAEAKKGSPTAQEVKGYVDFIRVGRDGGMLKIEITNPVEYAAYVEFGHRQDPGRYVPALGKRLKEGWVEGKFMMTIAEREVQNIAPKVLEGKIKKFLRECMQ